MTYRPFTKSKYKLIQPGFFVTCFPLLRALYFKHKIGIYLFMFELNNLTFPLPNTTMIPLKANYSYVNKNEIEYVTGEITGNGRYFKSKDKYHNIK